MNEDIKKPLKEWRDEAIQTSTKLSDINRSFAFAGIAIIWIFRNADQNGLIIPESLILPLVLIVVSFVLDYFQYLWKLVNSYHLYYSKERLFDQGKLSSEDISDVKIKNFYRTVTWVFFVGKLLSLICGYVLIFCYLIGRL